MIPTSTPIHGARPASRKASLTTTTVICRNRHSVSTMTGNIFGSAPARRATTRTRCRARHRSRRPRGVHRPSKTEVAASGEAVVEVEVVSVPVEEVLLLLLLALVPVEG